ncbi:MAG: NADH-quinone oxidoreductase subunit A [Cytophagales bacterium]|jgi:NADH-quinone oxidoreductase subunit A|nr:NADH-quinone oxidoreductase subunit A [Cytophagales bacterium]
MNTQYLPSDYLPIVIQLAAAIGFVILTMVTTNYLLPALKLGPRRSSKTKDNTWECGIESEGDARSPISVKYFLTAILFVLFDVEIIFMYPWAVNFTKLGWDGFWQMLLFLALLLAGFFYVIKKGVLKWEQ